MVPSSPEFLDLIRTLYASPHVIVYGFYAHAGNSYASTSFSEASSFLSSEVQSVNLAARLALDELSKFPGSQSVEKPFILSVGSTPTAHAVTRQELAEKLFGSLELHAGEIPWAMSFVEYNLFIIFIQGIIRCWTCNKSIPEW